MNRQTAQPRTLRLATLFAAATLLTGGLAIADDVRTAGIEGSESASIDDAFSGIGAIDDDDRRFAPTDRPEIPDAQRPPLSTPDNVDTNKPPHEWQRATDDWLGARPWLDDRGITLQSSFTAEYSKNLRGGTSTNGADFRNLFDANLTLNLERLCGLKGGTVFLSFQTQNGPTPSDVGSAQSTSSIDAGGITQLSEAWYEQVLFDGKLRVKAGKIDVNSEFAVPENAAEFMNASFACSPTILGIPTYPDPSFGMNVSVYPTEHVYAGIGIYDGAAQEGVATGSYGPATLFGGPSDLFLIAEAGLKWQDAGGRNGRIGVGASHHTGTFDRLRGSGAESGTSGFYVVADQMLWRENRGNEADAQGISLFAQYGYADPTVSEFHHHVGGGLSWKGALPHRDDDVAGFGVTYVRFADAADFQHPGELVIEVFYKIQLLPWLSVKPDLQYVHDPADADRDALAATVLAVIDL